MPLQKWSETIWVITLADEPLLSEELSQGFDRAQAAGTCPDLVLDLSGVSQLNSSNLSQLLRLRKLLVDHNRRLRLAGVDDGIWGLLLTTGLDKVFEFAPDVPTALASLQLGA